MSRFIGRKGVFIPVTLIKAGPNYVVNVKKDSKGRESVALGFEVVKEKALNKPQLGVLRKLVYHLSGCQGIQISWYQRKV